MKALFKKMFQFLNKKYSVRENVILDKNVHIGIGSILWAPNNLYIGKGSYIGKFVTIQVNGSIGRNVLIANNVGIIGKYDHDYTEKGKSIIESSWIGDEQRRETFFRDKDLSISIEEDCWIGYGAIILSGVKIGAGSIVAAGSVVTKDIEPYSIVAGNPARKISDRFSKSDLLEHLEVYNK